SVAFSPDGRQVLTGSVDNTARLWDATTGREIRSFTGHGDRVTSVAFSPDGRQVLTGGVDATARLWGAATGREIRSFTGHGGTVTSVAFSRDGQQVLAGSGDRTARMWDVATGREIRSFTGHEIYVNSVAFSPDGRQVLTGSWDWTARLWDAATGREIRSFTGHGGFVYSVAFSPDGRQVLTGSVDNTARLWDATTGREIRSFTGHGDSVTSVAFSPDDGRQVLTGSEDATARLWDTATGRELATFPHLLSVREVAFAPDGRAVLTGGGDGIARLWPLDRAFWPPDPAFVATPRPRALALIIGNRTYTRGAPEVAYAHNDADAYYTLFTEVMGLDPQKVILRKEVGSVEFQELFGSDQVPGLLDSLAEFVDEIFVVYIGHGAPGFDRDGKPIPYVLPVDVSGANPALGGMALSELTHRLAALQVPQVTLILDACFSGLSHAGPVVPQASPFGVGFAEPLVTANLTVMSATAFDEPQYASWLDAEKHSALSYSVLRGLYGEADETGDADGRVTIRELEDYVREKVTFSVLSRLQRRQSPYLSHSGENFTMVDFSRSDSRPSFPVAGAE
ncbi:MAG: caspase family protein, partial [Rhodobacter sp.]|nr:caspase family protein [Rhodobacter sp.]